MRFLFVYNKETIKFVIKNNRLDIRLKEDFSTKSIAFKLADTSQISS